MLFESNISLIFHFVQIVHPALSTLQKCDAMTIFLRSSAPIQTSSIRFRSHRWIWWKKGIGVGLSDDFAGCMAKVRRRTLTKLF